MEPDLSRAGFTTLAKSGAGALTLANANTYTGTTTLSAGQLNLNNASAIGTGTLVLAGGTIGNTSGQQSALTLTTNNPQTWSGNFTFSGGSDLNLGMGAVTLNGSIQNTVTVNGSGTLTVGGGFGR